jgi:hypothetical protein
VRWLACVLLFCACETEPVPTWHTDVAPLLASRCAGCHADNAIGGFSLTRYEEAASRAPEIATLTAGRIMPPWGVDASGTCGTYQDARWLSDDEIALLARWADAGAPEGDPSRAQAIVVDDALPINPTTTIKSETSYTPNATRPDDYRCFIVEPANASDAFLTAFRVRPQRADMVHHVILFAVDEESGETRAAELDDAEEGPGYTCFGGASVAGARPVAGWAPGVPVMRYPDDTGVRLISGRKMIMQVHYNTSHAATVQSDQSEVDLELVDEVREEGLIVGLADTTLSLPPGEASIESVYDMPLQSMGLPLGVFVRGVFPHMHTRGTKMHFEIVREGESDCAVDVPRWDFDWQQFYFYDEPLYLYPTDTLRLSCTYSTLDETEELHFGEGTGDEMCLMGLYVTLF